MKKLIIRFVTILLAFVAGAGFMNYLTYIVNRDINNMMSDETLR